MNLKPEWIEAIQHMQRLYGRQWKHKVAFAWSASMSPRDPDTAAALRQMRNQLGPDWLAAYRPGDIGVGWVARGQIEVPHGGSYRTKSAWRITHQDGKDKIQPYFTNKGDMRATARHLGITLIEDNLP